MRLWSNADQTASPGRRQVVWAAWAVIAVGFSGGFAAGQQADDRGTVRRSSSQAVIDFINERIRQGWTDNEIKPSAEASDEEWLRRVYLDIVGHVPPADVIVDFLADRDKHKRSKVVDRLLDDDGYVRNFTTIWTNLCIGRQTPQRVSRVGMQKFFREAFYRNRPWNEVVQDLIAAEGHFEENGAVNYLLAQMTMRDDGVQATAKTTRLFLGIQVQCTQCHNHPFNDWKQDQFWQFNAFFRQADRRDVQRYDARSGRMVDDYSELLTRNNVDAAVFYENRQAIVSMALPIYFGHEIESESDGGKPVDRREALARLIAEGADGEVPLVAKATVNRMWGQFFGYGFTRPVDDMGPHNPASHPELLDGLAAEFVKANYDLKQLIRWIAGSEAYQLTSQSGASNAIDNPAAGETPLFSHLYLKSMTAEQLYDSLIIATEAHQAGRSSWDEAQRQRNEWLQQFVIAFDTDENDEQTMFNGTIPQALMMMNGELVQNAISPKPGGFLHEALASRGNDTQKINKLYLSTLSRHPTGREMNAARQLIARYPTPIEGYQDLFWALLNSNEFILIH